MHKTRGIYKSKNFIAGPRKIVNHFKINLEKEFTMKVLLGLMLISLSFNGHAATKIRIGWQVPWAIQGQIVQIWKHTDILKKHDLEAEFVGKTFGPELNEIALAGQIDVVLTADQPAAALFSKEKGWVGISRLMYNRTATYVPPKSPIKTLTDLKGKTIGVPMGAAAQRVLLDNLQAKGLKATDVKLINLGMPEQGPLLKKAGKEAVTWDQFDALAGFDPAPATFEVAELARIIDSGKVCALVLMNKEFLSANKGVAKKMATALKEAYSYYKSHTEEADKWFIEEAKLTGVDSAVLAKTIVYEPNLKAKSDKEIRVTFNKDDFAILQGAADFVSGMTGGKKINMKDFVSNDYVK